MAGREGFDLFNKYQRQGFFEKFKGKPLPCLHKIPWKIMLSDTFIPWYCKVVGHRTYKTDEGDTACNRCWRYVQTDGK
jgi:hypothetical protein